MSTSLLYHEFGLRVYSYQGVQREQENTIINIRHQPGSLCCSHCGSKRVSLQGTVTRRFRDTWLGKHPVYFELPVQRVHCHHCGKTRQTHLHFADPKRHYTHNFERHVWELSRHMSMQAVAGHLDIGWDVVKDILKRGLAKMYARIPLKHLKHIAIDEISVGRGHQYLTVVLDLDSGAVVFVGNGKDSASLKPFWKKLRSAGADIKAVASDMSRAYISAVMDNLPQAKHVLDRFHVMKLYNHHLADLRRQVQRSVENVEHKKLLKGTHWLLLKNPENLNPERDEPQRLKDALRINEPLAAAYYLKEDLKQLWGWHNKEAAERFLDAWIVRAEASQITMLKKFANTLRLHRSSLLNWYDYPISTAALEGTNTKIRVMQRQAYGFRDHEFFKLKIYHLHKTTYALVG